MNSEEEIKQLNRKIDNAELLVDELRAELSAGIVVKGEVDYELDVLGLPYNCSIGGISLEDIMIDVVSGKRGTKVKLIIHKCKESK